MRSVFTKNSSWILGLFLVCTSNPVPAETAAETKRSSELPEFRNMVKESGFLFINGEWVARPYEIRADLAGLSINGTFCPVNLIRRDSSAPTAFESRRRRNDEVGDAQRGRVQEESGPVADEVDRPLQGSGFVAGWAGPGPSWVDSDRRLSFAARREASRISEALASDGIVLLSDRSQPVYIELPASRLTFLEAVVNRSDVPPHAEFLLDVPPQDRRAVLAWIRDFRPPAELAEKAAGLLQQNEQRLAADRAMVSALQLMDTLNYPLTMLGMLLGVLALGHILKWTARMVAIENGAASEPSLIRCVEVGLLLMLAMSILDLAWTAVAFRAGVMRELNPVAAQLVGSPMHLILFKVVATGAGGAILFVWRHRSQIQQAAWWMCLVCVLLTFRWVVFDSVLN